MKLEQTLPRVKNILFGIALIAACGIIQFSCKKPANNEMISVKLNFWSRISEA